MNKDEPEQGNHANWACHKYRIREFYAGGKIGFFLWLAAASVIHYLLNLK